MKFDLKIYSEDKKKKRHYHKKETSYSWEKRQIFFAKKKLKAIIILLSLILIYYFAFQMGLLFAHKMDHLFLLVVDLNLLYMQMVMCFVFHIY